MWRRWEEKRPRAHYFYSFLVFSYLFLPDASPKDSEFISFSSCGSSVEASCHGHYQLMILYQAWQGIGPQSTRNWYCATVWKPLGTENPQPSGGRKTATYKLWFPTKSLITVIIPVQSCKFMCALDPSPNPPCTLKMKYFWLLMWRVGGLVRHIQDNMMKARWEPIKCNLLFYFTIIFCFLGLPSIHRAHPPAKKPQKYCILFVFLVGFFGIMGGWTGLRPGPENAQKALIIPCILLL